MKPWEKASWGCCNSAKEAVVILYSLLILLTQRVRRCFMVRLLAPVSSAREGCFCTSR